MKFVMLIPTLILMSSSVFAAPRVLGHIDIQGQSVEVSLDKQNKTLSVGATNYKLEVFDASSISGMPISAHRNVSAGVDEGIVVFETGAPAGFKVCKANEGLVIRILQSQTPAQSEQFCLMK